MAENPSSAHTAAVAAAAAATHAAVASAVRHMMHIEGCPATSTRACAPGRGDEHNTKHIVTTTPALGVF